MILYLDASALAKLFLTEPSTELVQELMEQASSIVTSRVAYAEVCSAFARRRRAGQLSSAELSAALADLNATWHAFGVIEVDEQSAGQLATKHGLRALDAIHLAAALRVRTEADREPIVFCSFDVEQARAAETERFTAAPPPKPRSAPAKSKRFTKPRGRR